MSILLQTSLFLTTAFLALVPEAAGRPPRTPALPSGNGTASVGKAVYLITNDQVNSVVALPIGADGTLSAGTVTGTGGAGSIAVSAEGQPSVPDALVSQSALTLAGNYIFTVNAGCNTLSMLSISPTNPTQLSLVGRPVAIPGDFPSTVAASARNGLVCVGTTGARSGIACSRFSSKGLSRMDHLRAFNLNQTTPPVAPLNTVSHTFFSADETTLFTTVKGDPPANKTGFLSAFSVERTRMGGASLGMAERRTSPSGTAVLFGSQPIPGTSNIFATDASFGATVLSVDSATKEARTLARGEIAGQGATCWVTISSVTGTAFVTDVAVNRIVEMRLEDASIVGELDLSANGDPGLLDLRAGGNFIYALSPGNGTTEAAVTVVDVSGGSGSAKMVQHFTLNGLAGKTAMGMAVLV